MTLYRRRKELGLAEEAHFSDISDSDLKMLLLSLKDRFPDCGERIIIGAQGFRVPRHRIRSVIHEVDPVNTALRWHPRILRQPYSVPGPMSLWHVGKIVYYNALNFILSFQFCN